MFARLGTWEGSPDQLDQWVARAQQQVKPNVSRLPGLHAAYWLLDRPAGKGMTLTIWESKEAMDASEQFRQRSQAATSDASGARVHTEHFEVVDHL